MKRKVLFSQTDRLLKIYCYLAFLLGVLLSCSNSVTEQDIQNNLNKTLILDMFKTVQKKDSIIPYQKLRQKYPFISVVYLEDGCQPCYPKFIEWHHKMDSISIQKNHTVLFVVKGNNYERFIENILEVAPINIEYFMAMDKNYSYLDSNITIPQWIIDSSILIDAQNKIKLIGEPWRTTEITNLFRKIVK